MEPDLRKGRPPAPLSRLFGLLIPPPAREAVLGDLEERYRSPIQYASEGIGIMPHLLASSARRTSSIAIVGLQTFVLIACLGVTLPDLPGPALPAWVQGGIPVAAALAALVLRAVYRGDETPVRSGFLDAVAAAAAMLLSQAVLAALVAAGVVAPGWLLPAGLYMLGFFALPALCIIGAADGRDRGAGRAGASPDQAADAVVQDYLRFEQRVRARNRAEMIALGLIVALSAGILLRFNPPLASVAWPFLAAFAAVLGFLAVRGWARPIPSGAGLEPVRTHYRSELARQNGLRGFMWWLWFGPIFVGLVANLILFGIRMDPPLRIASGSAALLVLAGLIVMANRDRTRAVRERIAALSASAEGASG
jgi:hypothetical protein